MRNNGYKISVERVLNNVPNVVSAEFIVQLSDDAGQELDSLIVEEALFEFVRTSIHWIRYVRDKGKTKL